MHFDATRVFAGKMDQLAHIADELQNNPASRRVVLSMWDPKADLGHVGKDVPCNTSVYFDIRDSLLNMTVLNRSNDIIWGCYGANMVQFSILQEFMATWIGVGVGEYRQFSNNFHVYTETFNTDVLEAMMQDAYDASTRYDDLPLGPAALIETSAAAWQTDLLTFMSNPEGYPVLEDGSPYKDEFFTDVAQPMYAAWVAHKAKSYAQAIDQAEQIAAPDWRWACIEWLERRKAKHEGKAS